MPKARTRTTLSSSLPTAKPAARVLRLTHACPWPIVLGIDPGTRTIGYGAVVARPKGARLFAAGALHGDRSADVPRRLGQLLRELERVLEEVRPNVVVVEQAFAGRNVQSALRIGEGRGVVLALCADFGCEVVQFPPAVAKKVLVGNGAADKTQVAAMVAELLGLERAPEPLDASDALGLALAFVLRRERELRFPVLQTRTRTKTSARIARS